uniref:Uncharacterized protein n=1 Tax=Toxoplasma gondii COUG TaxID=1074873 RepID=A0A2G8XV68_TOXGO|nr:hypothetical protein TGCOUG_222270 [Toxoplasma gondii COUG]
MAGVFFRFSFSAFPARLLCASVSRLCILSACSPLLSGLVVSLLLTAACAFQFQSFVPGVTPAPLSSRLATSAYISTPPVPSLPRLSSSTHGLGVSEQKSSASKSSFHEDRILATVPPGLASLASAPSEINGCLRSPALGAAPGCTDTGNDAEATPLAMTLRSYLRCHMSLLSDTSPAFNNGNLMFLFRAADAHDRLLSPLELHTNVHHLPGADAARVMVALEPEALEAAGAQADSGVQTAQTQNFPRELLKFEVRRLHRLLQFACAGQLRGEFLSRASTKVMLDLFQEADLPLSTVLDAFTEMSKFYEKKMPAEVFKTHFKPSLDALVSQLLDIQKEYVAEEKSPRPVLSEVTFEPEPDSRTLTPLLVDITTMGDKLPGVAAWNKKA